MSISDLLHRHRASPRPWWLLLHCLLRHRRRRPLPRPHHRRLHHPHHRRHPLRLPRHRHPHSPHPSPHHPNYPFMVNSST